MCTYMHAQIFFYPLMGVIACILTGTQKPVSYLIDKLVIYTRIRLGVKWLISLFEALFGG